MKRSGPLKRKTPLKQKPIGKSKSKARQHRKPSPNEFPERVKIAAARRSGYRCEIGSEVCTGRASQFHHRQSRRFKDQRLVNCLHVCLHCHEYIGNAGAKVGWLMGWLVHEWQDPAEVPVLPGARRKR